MNKLFSWVKTNKLTFALILVVLYLLVKGSGRPLTSYSTLLKTGGGDFVSQSANVSSVARGGTSNLFEAAPQPEVKDRLLVEESNVSIVVDKVRERVDAIVNYVSSKNGYLVSSSISQPEESPSATVVLRLPQPELRPAIEMLRKMAVKVTYEYLSGYDVTDQYLDIEARLATLMKTKARFEEIMAQAVKVEEIMQVQREIINLQEQIDSLKGRQDYLKKTAENAKLTVYLAADEWSLPFAPVDGGFRPKVIFKQAVRALVRNIRSGAQAAIWLGVYAAIWLPVLVVVLIVRKKLRKKDKN